MKMTHGFLSGEKGSALVDGDYYEIFDRDGKSVRVGRWRQRQPCRNYRPHRCRQPRHRTPE